MIHDYDHDDDDVVIDVSRFRFVSLFAVARSSFVAVGHGVTSLTIDHRPRETRRRISRINFTMVRGSRQSATGSSIDAKGYIKSTVVKTEHARRDYLFIISPRRTGSRTECSRCCIGTKQVQP
jgi:hypothetical protein